MMWLMTGDTIPILIFKAETADAAKKMYLDKVVPKYAEEVQRGMKIRLLTLEELDSLTPDQFAISNETGC